MTGGSGWPGPAGRCRGPINSHPRPRCSCTGRTGGATQKAFAEPTLLIVLAVLWLQGRTLMANYKRGFGRYSEFVATDDEPIGDARPPRFYSPRECARLMGFPETFVLGAAGTGGEEVRAPHRRSTTSRCWSTTISAPW